MNNDTPITDKQAGWAIAGQYGISRGKELMPDKDGPFVHACIARELERENAAMKAAIRALAVRDFGSGGWDAECESAALRLRAFLSDLR